MRIKGLLLASIGTAIIAGFDGMGWKKDDDGHIVVDDKGNPVLAIDGGEMSVESGTVARLTNESKRHRERAEAAETKLTKFDGLDPDKAREALDMVGKIDDKKLIDAGKVDEVRNEMRTQYEKQIADAQAERDAATQRADNMLVSQAFRDSKFVNEQLILPADIAQKTFGDHFKVEDGKVVPQDSSGNPIYSKKRAGEVADADEAMEIIVGAYAHRDMILKAPDTNGTGGQGGGGGRGNGRVMKRSEFDTLSPAQQAEAAASMGKGEIQIVD